MQSLHISKIRHICFTAVFLSIFKWETRKGWDVLLDAFLGEFKESDLVELHLMTHSLSDGAQGVGFG
jgi:hypothetical protein